MIKKIKASKSEKVIFIFIIFLALFSFSFFFLIKNKCLLVKDYDPKKITFENPKNIVVLNISCGNVIIELYPDISPNTVKRFRTLVESNAYDDIAFHRVIKETLVQAGDLEFGKKGNLDYGKIGTGKSGLGTINSEIDSPFNFNKGSVGFARTQKYNTEDSQFFIVLRDEPLYETEYTPIGKVLYGLEALNKIKHSDRSQYVLRPDYINSLRMLIN
ncbi:peptidylprolyl isomerase [Candidatus Pelagibacter sp.]|nr:peptidylprolyl isomerase [Candidatus Pelagibacter sp.]|tara:strand:+ start:725 stop:1372 length:648 start_codon:yes stop_codon:yes gene_type:complete